MTRFTKETRSRGATKANEALRRSAAHDRARTCIKALTDGLDDQDPDFAAEVFRAVVRAIGSALVQRVGVARAVGVLTGVLTNISPAWRSESEAARSEAEMLFAEASS